MAPYHCNHLNDENVCSPIRFGLSALVWSDPYCCVRVFAFVPTIYFVFFTGRSASHIALECALQTRPNVCIICEEVQAKGSTLVQLTQQVLNVDRKGARDVFKVSHQKFVRLHLISFFPACLGGGHDSPKSRGMDFIKRLFLLKRPLDHLLRPLPLTLSIFISL